MECFAHPNQSAIAICKYCNRAVCRSCARETPGGIACSEACEVQVQKISQMMDAACRAYGIGAGRRSLPTSVMMPALLGAGFLLYGLIDLTWWRTGMVLFMGPMGLILLFGAWYSWRKYRDHGINV